MKENNKLLVLAGLIAVAALVWYYSSKAPTANTNSSADPAATYQPLAVENPELRREVLEHSRTTEYKGAGRDLFSEIAPPPPEAIAARKEVARANVGPTPEPPPPPPALPPNMKFFGYGTVPNGSAKLAFLTDGDNVFIVSEGETLLGKYRVVKIGNANLDFEEIATGRRGSTTLSEEPAAPAS